VPLGILALFSDLDYNKVLHNRICRSPVFIREPTLPYLDRHLKLAKINSRVRRGRAVIPCLSRGMRFLLAYVRRVAGGDAAAAAFLLPSFGIGLAC
jgi:hypothetical protein